MRAWTIILAVLCAAALALTGTLYLTANVTVTGVECVATDAADQPELFAALRDQTDRGIFTGTLFEGGRIAEGKEYQFYTYTVRLRNDTFVRAEVAEIQVTPMGSDVLQMERGGPASIPARGNGEIQATILTEQDMHNVRELVITYYLWGLPFTVKTTYSRTSSAR